MFTTGSLETCRVYNQSFGKEELKNAHYMSLIMLHCVTPAKSATNQKYVTIIIRLVFHVPHLISLGKGEVLACRSIWVKVWCRQFLKKHILDCSLRVMFCWQDVPILVFIVYAWHLRLCCISVHLTFLYTYICESDIQTSDVMFVPCFIPLNSNLFCPFDIWSLTVGGV